MIANNLIQSIANCGRKFFNYQGRIAKIEMAENGRLWFRDDYTNKLICLHNHYRWKYISHGGTMRGLLICLRKYIMYDIKLSHHMFSDIWGYDQDIIMVKDRALELGIIG